MNSGPVSVKQAIECGIRLLRVPARRILFVATVSMPVIWYSVGFMWWTLLPIPFAVLVAFIYASSLRPKWRRWAYANVTDIHQFQRAAELARLLPGGSHDEVRGWMTFKQREELSGLLERFSNDPGFIDDPVIPAKTEVFERILSFSNRQPLITIDNTGIRLHGEGTFSWGDIENERIANVGFKRIHWRFRYELSSTTSRYFRINCGNKQYEFRMEDIKMSAWELDLLMYIYRGRWEASQQN